MVSTGVPCEVCSTAELRRGNGTRGGGNNHAHHRRDLTRTRDPTGPQPPLPRTTMRRFTSDTCVLARQSSWKLDSSMLLIRIRMWSGSTAVAMVHESTKQQFAPPPPTTTHALFLHHPASHSRGVRGVWAGTGAQLQWVL